MNFKGFYRIYFFDFEDLKYYPLRYSFGPYSRVRHFFELYLKVFPDGRFIMSPA